jgi:glycosyltransferase involved in cell wall biosynthesis
MSPAETIEPIAAAPRVSVITPFLNAQSFLAEAVESVRAQSTQDWELLLIDDGSTDGSSATARGYAANTPERIRYLHHAGHRNRGKSVSRNLGIAHARGEFVVFLDADDVLLPHKLRHQIDLLDKHPHAAMIYGNTEYWTSWNANRKARERDHLGKLGVPSGRSHSPPTLVTTWLRKPGTVPCLCAGLARIDTVRRVGGYEEDIHDLYEDQVFLVKMAMAAPVYVESGWGERYRQHSQSTSARAIAAGSYHPLRPNPARLKFLRWLQDYLSSLGVLQGELARALHAALRPYRHPALYRALHPLIVLAARFK